MNKVKCPFIFFSLILICKVSFSQTNKTGDGSAVQKAMDTQLAAWNKGNIEGFMDYYWNNDSLKFVGSKGITYGWKKTLENYKKNYPDKDAMGVLTFVNSSMEQLSSVSFFVIGKWNIKKKDGSEVGGYYTLLWKKIKNKWMIVVDHTS